MRRCAALLTAALVCTGAVDETSMNPGWNSMSTVMNTGASVSPCLFVQPAARATAAATTMVNRSLIFMTSCPPYDRRIRGVMNMSSSSYFSVRVLLRKRLPSTGIFQRPGIMLF